VWTENELGIQVLLAVEDELVAAVEGPRVATNRSLPQQRLSTARHCISPLLRLQVTDQAHDRGGNCRISHGGLTKGKTP
jgi:hypothetical protein